MKTIKIRGLYRLPWLIKLLLVIFVPLVAWLFVVGIMGEPLLVVVGIIFFGSMAVAFGFYFCYGIKISQKRVTVVGYQELRTFRRDEIIRFDLFISKESIRGEIKARGEKPYEFILDDFNLNHAALVFPSLFDVKFKVSDRYIERLKSRLDGVERVNVRFI